MSTRCHCLDILSTFFHVFVSDCNSSITPLLRIVQTFLNDPTLYEAVAELPEHLDFVTTIITIATHAKFASIQGESVISREICLILNP